MGNLNYPKTVLLYNSLTAADIGSYLSGDGHIHLLFRDKGIDIPGCHVASEGAGLSISNATRCSVSCSDAGALREVCLELAIQCPCVECDFEWGITVNHIEKSTGIVTNYFPPPQKYYGDRLAKVECTNGYIDDTYLLQMEKSILNMVAADEYAFITAHRKYYVTGWSATAALTVVLTMEDGTEHVLTEASGVANLGAMVTAMQANIDAISALVDNLEVSHDGADSDTSGGFYFYGVNGFVYTLAVTTVVIEARYLCVVQLYPDVSFSVEYSPGTATKTVITEGRFPALTGTDVARIFSAAGHHGSLSQIVTRNVPDPDANYCLFSFRTLHNHKYDLVGASHLNDYYQYLDVYIKEDYVDDLLWLASELGSTTITSESPVSPDAAFYDSADSATDLYSYFCDCTTVQA